MNLLLVSMSHTVNPNNVNSVRTVWQVDLKRSCVLRV